MVIFDTTFLLHLIDPALPPPMDPHTSKPVVEVNRRIAQLVSELRERREKIIIPTPALSELLVLAEQAGAGYLTKLSKSSVFQIESFDARAAVELAVMTATAKKAGDIRAGSTASMAKIKFDRQIVAIARVHRVSVIYTNDNELRKFAADRGIKAIAVWELPLPPIEVQLPLPWDQPDDNPPAPPS